MQSQSNLKGLCLQERAQETTLILWNNLTDKQRSLLKQGWGVLTYKWRWQIVLNTPFLILWMLDKTIPQVHNFDMKILSSLPIPDWMASWFGLG